MDFSGISRTLWFRRYLINCFLCSSSDKIITQLEPALILRKSNLKLLCITITMIRFLWIENYHILTFSPFGWIPPFPLRSATVPLFDFFKIYMDYPPTFRVIIDIFLKIAPLQELVKTLNWNFQPSVHRIERVTLQKLP